jgi:hypothetical protein
VVNKREPSRNEIEIKVLRADDRKYRARLSLVDDPNTYFTLRIDETHNRGQALARITVEFICVKESVAVMHPFVERLLLDIKRSAHKYDAPVYSEEDERTQIGRETKRTRSRGTHPKRPN